MTINVEFKDFEEMTAFAEKLVSKGGNNAKDLSNVVKEIKEEKKIPRGNKPAEEFAENSAVSNDGAAESISDDTSGFEGEVKSYTLEEVRAKLVQLTRTGKQKEVKALLTSFEAENISSVKVEDYAAVMEKAALIGKVVGEVNA